MKKFFLFLIASVFSGSTLSQTIPILSKEWTGVLTLTSMGSTTMNNPNYKSSENNNNQDWNSYTQPRKLTIKKQEGRSLEILVRGPRVESVWVGTLSADGKEIVLAGKHASGLLKIVGNQMHGCGTSRGMDGNFEHWLNSYSAWCWEFIPEKS